MFYTQFRSLKGSSVPRDSSLTIAGNNPVLKRDSCENQRYVGK